MALYFWLLEVKSMGNYKNEDGYLLDKDYSKKLNKLFNLISEAHLNFYTWKSLQDEAFEPIFSEDPYFWNAVLFSLEYSWLSDIAKIYENSTYSKKSKVISVYALWPNQIDPTKSAKIKKILTSNGSTIKSIQLLRHNQLAHNNVDYLLHPKILLRKFPIKYGDAEKLLLISGELLSLLDLREGHAYSFKPFIQDCESSGKHVIEKIRYFSKLRREHSDKFVRREIDDPHFPPEK